MSRSGFKVIICQSVNTNVANDLARNNPIPTYKGIYHAMNTIYKEEGFFSLYRGVIINMIAGSLANSVFFYVYQDGK
jgi:hypothetical protein